MKLSISLPDSMAREIQKLSQESDRGVSWWVQRAWEVARARILGSEKKAHASHQRFLKTLRSMRGILKDEFPGVDSVTLAHRAFLAKK